MFLQTILASMVGSVFALLGGIILLWKENFARKISLILVSFATGSLLGAAFLELLPEALGELSYEWSSIILIVGILSIFLFEKAIKFYHHHDHESHEHTLFTKTVLAGDAFHNFIDGLVIALAFSEGTAVGITATVAIFFHEVPQEIGDFGVLLHAGYKKSKIIWLNILTALTTPFGAILGYLLLPWISQYIPFFLAFAAGIFIYISVSDLLPELKDKKTHWSDVFHIVSIIFGVAVIWMLGIYIAE